MIHSVPIGCSIGSNHSIYQLKSMSGSQQGPNKQGTRMYNARIWSSVVGPNISRSGVRYGSPNWACTWSQPMCHRQFPRTHPIGDRFYNPLPAKSGMKKMSALQQSGARGPNGRLPWAILMGKSWSTVKFGGFSTSFKRTQKVSHSIVGVYGCSSPLICYYRGFDSTNSSHTFDQLMKAKMFPPILLIKY